ncbi:MAG: lysophospholipid acyltransferase family protein [Bdellovibrionales bacterium]|nr:lysophospholipid acyltransferase family protein [Bdellovibrionales bacterium]
MFTRLIYYCVIIPISLLPMWILYRFSDGLFLLFRFLKPYRNRLVLENLRRAFPEKSQAEIQEIAWGFYRHFCDLIVESIKSFTISGAEIKRRMAATGIDFLDPFKKPGTTFLLGAGHYGNWEWYAVSSQLHSGFQGTGIYKPLSNKFLDGKMRETRCRFGFQMIPMKEAKDWLAQRKPSDAPGILVYASDQSPTDPRKAHWGKFFGMDTAMLYGIEKHARETGLPVLFGRIRRLKRGHYQYQYEMLTSNPRETPEGWIIEEIHRRVEKQIREDPRYWLWTHRRWKHAKPADLT